MLKIEAKSFRDTGHCKDIEGTGNLGPIAGFKGVIIQKQALFYFYFRFRVEHQIIPVLIYAVCSVFSFVLFSSPPKSFFRLNHVRKAWNRCFHSRFSSEAIILGFFLPKRRLVLLWATVAHFVESSNDTR